MKTNAMRCLDQAKISYRTHEYPIKDIDDVSTQAIKYLPLADVQLFKTLLTIADQKEIYVFCIPLLTHLDLKKAAKIIGHKKVEMLPHKNVLSISGYQVGGCSPIGMKKHYPTYIDETAILYDEIGVSGGARGSEILIEPNVLKEYVFAQFKDLTKD